MRPIPKNSDRRNRNLVAAVLFILGIGLVVGSVTHRDERRFTSDDGAWSHQWRRPDIGAPRVASPVGGRRATAPLSIARRHGQVRRPTWIEVPAIGVSAPIVRLGVNGDGTMQVPGSPGEAGWFAPGPEPGERGAALIVGHVDWYRGPAVFYRLRALHRGDHIVVTVAGGTRITFVVTSAREVTKHAFPRALVYRATRRPTLRLITCGGRFDVRTRHYLANRIVFAWQSAVN
jgi:LPXTG-site transpeptidase (sortase) family protein